MLAELARHTGTPPQGQKLKRRRLQFPMGAAAGSVIYRRLHRQDVHQRHDRGWQGSAAAASLGRQAQG